MTDPNEDDDGPRGKVDAVSALYIAAGIPAIFFFLVILFVAEMLWDIPA
jgi:hypothetical protein